MNSVQELLRKLTSSPGVSGFERELGISGVIASLLAGACIDEQGNVLYTTGRGTPVVVVDAHIDEVGYFVGYKNAVPIGDVSLKWVKKTEMNKKVAYFTRAFSVRNGVVRAPALDNRAGCAVAVLAAQQVPIGMTVHWCFSVQEETTYAGIRKCIRELKPDIVICIDAGYATPCSIKGEIPSVGKGPAIQPQGTGFMSSLWTRAEKIAIQKGIPFQFEIVASNEGATNLSGFTHDKVLQLNVPVRYQHTPLSECSISDVQNTAKLLHCVLESIVAQRAAQRS